MRTAFLLSLALSSHVVAADPKPDFTVEAEAYAKESRSNPAAFQKKYGGKLVEVTGVVRLTEIPGFRVRFEGAKADSGKRNELLVTGTASEAARDQLRPLAKGQEVTIRGKQLNSTAPQLSECAVVKAGPSTAIPVTIAGLVAEWKADRDAAGKKYLNQPAVARVKVMKTETQGITVLWEVTDPDVKGGPVGQVMLSGGSDDDFLKGLQKVKPGDVVVVLTPRPGPEAKPLLWESIILKEPPAGVKLPENKK